MADLSGLYPQAPQPQQQGILSGNPLQAIGILNQLQDYRIRQQQAPALAQQPAANLAGTNISNATAQLQQQDAARRTLAAALGARIAGIDNPTPDDVHSATAYIARSYPQIQAQYPDMLPAAADTLLKEPKGIKYGAGLLLNSGMSPSEASSLVEGPMNPNTAQKTLVPVTQSNLSTTPRTVTPPIGSDVSATAMQSDLARESAYRSDMFPLQQALDRAKALGPGGMAPGSSTRQQWESFVYGLTPQLVPQAVQDKIKNYAELEKYLTQAMQNRAQSLGPHTNDGLGSAIKGSPNVNINDLAGVDLIKAAIGIRNMEHAQVIEAAKQGPVNYTTNKTNAAANWDPRAFMMNMYSPAEIQNLQKTLKGPERAKFNASLKSAIDAGVVTP